MRPVKDLLFKFDLMKSFFLQIIFYNRHFLGVLVLLITFVVSDKAICDVEQGKVLLTVGRFSWQGEREKSNLSFLPETINYFIKASVLSKGLDKRITVMDSSIAAASNLKEDYAGEFHLTGSITGFAGEAVISARLKLIPYHPELFTETEDVIIKLPNLLIINDAVFDNIDKFVSQVDIAITNSFTDVFYAGNFKKVAAACFTSKSSGNDIEIDILKSTFEQYFIELLSESDRFDINQEFFNEEVCVKKEPLNYFVDELGYDAALGGNIEFFDEEFTFSPIILVKKYPDLHGFSLEELNGRYDTYMSDFESYIKKVNDFLGVVNDGLNEEDISLLIASQEEAVSYGKDGPDTDNLALYDYLMQRSFSDNRNKKETPVDNTEKAFKAYVEGIGLLEEGAWEEAYDRLIESVKLNQSYVPALVNLADLEVRLGEIDDAIRHYSLSLDLMLGDWVEHENHYRNIRHVSVRKAYLYAHKKEYGLAEKELKWLIDFLTSHNKPIENKLREEYISFLQFSGNNDEIAEQLKLIKLKRSWGGTEHVASKPINEPVKSIADNCTPNHTCPDKTNSYREGHHSSEVSKLKSIVLSASNRASVIFKEVVSLASGSAEAILKDVPVSESKD